MKRFIAAAFLISVSVSAAFAEDFLRAPAAARESIAPLSSPVTEDARRKVAVSASRSWRWSLAPLLAAHSLDAASSWGRREQNFLLADSTGRFEMKAAGIKFGFVGAAILAEYLLVKHHPKLAKFIVLANRGNAVVTTGLAVHNFAMVH